MFYWCLLNLPASVRYNLVNIKLLAVAKSDCLNENNIRLLLHNFIETMNKLNRTGIELTINGKFEHLNAFLAFALGDTLALQWLGGFVVGVGSAKKFCRTCEITSKQKNENPDNIYSLRCQERHLLQLRLIKKSSELISEYGVKFESPLLEISQFDLTKCLLHDPMHVLVEGVCVKELTNLLNYIIDQYGVDLEKINNRILSFKFAIIDSTDKPNLIKLEHIKKGSFAQSAGQMLILILILPFILGDFVTEFDENWLNFINLHQIVNLVFSFIYDDVTIKQLEDKITQYLLNFKILYKNINLTPKMHYLSHFPAQLKNFGPLRLHACFRFESKNGLMADLNFQNFINISFSCSNKHQLWMASKENDFKKRKSFC